MSSRLLSALTVTAALLVAPALPAHAGAVCRQLTDPSGDARLLGATNTTGQGSYPSLDILSADIATGKTNLVAALRVKTLQRDTALAGGTTYYLSWTLNGTVQRLTYYTFAASSQTMWLYNQGVDGDSAVTGTTDDRTGTIYWTVPRAKLKTLRKHGLRFTGLSARSMVAFNYTPPAIITQTHESSEADSASSSRTYVDGTATCLKGA